LMETTNELLEIGALQPHPRNYNRHPAEQVRKLAKSLRKMGQVRSIVVWRGTILAGHGVVEAAKSLKWKTIRADVLPDEYPEELALAYVAADNELARQGDPDLAQLLGILEESRAADEELLEAMGFDADEFAALLADVGGGTKTGELVDAEPQIDRAEELRTKWCVETGQLWQLGDHRLICGDCTAPVVVKRVMGVEKAGLLFTSPPYAQQRTYKAESADSLTDWDALMQGAIGSAICSDDAQILVNLGMVHHDGEWFPYWEEWIEWMRAQGWRRFGWYVWDQGAGLPGDWSGRLAPSFEFIFHFNKSAIKADKWVDSKLAGQMTSKRTFRHDDGRLKPFTQNGGAYGATKIPDSVFRVNRQIGDTGHPAPFSIDFSGSVIRTWPGDVYEPFSGSGTTLIACEQLGRRCRAVEISPGYVAVALERWATATGKTPVLVD
jgi:DNA modification methylase/DNA-binding ferritin-like protein (Dps family)